MCWSFYFDFISGMNITLELPLFPNSLSVSRYLICIAALELSRSAACLISLADSTSALAEIILLSANLLYLAVLDSASCNSLLSWMSLMNISTISIPHSKVYWSTCFSISSAIYCLFSRMSCRTNWPHVFFKIAWVTYAIALLKSWTR